MDKAQREHSCKALRSSAGLRSYVAGQETGSSAGILSGLQKQGVSLPPLQPDGTKGNQAELATSSRAAETTHPVSAANPRSY